LHSELVIPLARIKRIAKLDPEVKNIQKDAGILITKATELFIAFSAVRTAQYASKRGKLCIFILYNIFLFFDNNILSFIKAQNLL
jgi:histone H3/H4